MIEHPGIGGRIAARSAANRRLIDDDNFVERFLAFYGAMSARTFFGAKPMTEQSPPQDVIHQRAFTGAAHDSDAGERAQRDSDVDILQVVLGSAEDFDPAS